MIHKDFSWVCIRSLSDVMKATHSQPIKIHKLSLVRKMRYAVSGLVKILRRSLKVASVSFQLCNVEYILLIDHFSNRG